MRKILLVASLAALVSGCGEKGDFEKALEYCIKLKTDHFKFKYDIKDLMGMIYYELGEYENFLYHLDS